MMGLSNATARQGAVYVAGEVVERILPVDRVLDGRVSSTTLTVTSIPRKEDAKPMKLPHRGRACAGSQATATRIRLRLPMLLLVGSNSTQPPPGTHTCPPTR